MYRVGACDANVADIVPLGETPVLTVETITISFLYGVLRTL